MNMAAFIVCCPALGRSRAKKGSYKLSEKIQDFGGFILKWNPENRQPVF
jgi:hypothetical protein